MKVLVLGAGVIGVASAYYLAKAGQQVVVVDRQSGAGRETSFANGGQIAAGHPDPWANPSTPAKILKWLGRGDAPLVFRPRVDPVQWAWGLQFLRNCTAARTQVNTERLLRVNVYSRRLLGELRRETGIQYDQRTKGILHIYRDPREFEHALAQAALVTSLGYVRRAVDVDECVALEPALVHARDKLVGGFYCPDDETGDAHTFTVRLGEICAGLGVEFHYDTTVVRLLIDGARISGAETSGGVLEADAYIVSLGSFSPLLVRPLGMRLPIYPAKGYSMTLPVEDVARAPEIGLIDDGRKIVYGRLGNRLRVAGTAEMSGYDVSLNEARTRPLLTQAMELFPGCGNPSKAEFWAGLRPKTPDSVPVMGSTRYENLFLNTGHGALGWTMACGAGRVIADLVGGAKPDMDVSGLGVERFS